MDVLKLFLTAGLLGKVVLLILLGMSFFSWYYIFYNLFHLRSLDGSLSELLRRLDQTTLLEASTLRSLFPAQEEIAGLWQRLTSYEKLRERLKVEYLAELAILERERFSLRITSGLGYLATCANTAPFIGLFGTVWGIMKAFHDIGLKGSASLATVAPGIAEALINTAMGLFVAIPASMAYNFFVLKKENILKKIEILSKKILLLTD